MGCLRVVHGVTKWDKMRNVQLRSLGGLNRMDGYEKEALLAGPPGKNGGLSYPHVPFGVSTC